MRFFLKRIRELGIGWNERPLTESDFYALCRRHKIVVDEIPLRVSGFYYCVKGGHYIAIDSKLPRQEKLFVMFHEFAHYLMHAPNTHETASYHGVGHKTRKEVEADIFALVAMIPRTWLETRTPEDIIDHDSIAPSRLSERLGVYEKHGL